ncbi:MAG: hypothetical protein O7B35_07530 [Deltaproteobacteria bacterium]|nr:hypothetical protein [Deltaproteobacteria bacterium]
MQIYRSQKEVGKLCRELRERNDMTQRELANAIGAKNIQDISNAENPGKASRFAMQQRILKHFNNTLSPAFIVEDDD